MTGETIPFILNSKAKLDTQMLERATHAQKQCYKGGLIHSTEPCLHAIKDTV